jgi:hypothetical protein
MERGTDFSRLQVVPRLPNYYHQDEGAELPVGLVGATILCIGTIDRQATPSMEPTFESGGLVIDYVPEGTSQPLRAVFAFNEVAMWVAYCREARDCGGSGSTQAFARG